MSDRQDDLPRTPPPNDEGNGRDPGHREPCADLGINIARRMSRSGEKLFFWRYTEDSINSTLFRRSSPAYRSNRSPPVDGGMHEVLASQVRGVVAQRPRRALEVLDGLAVTNAARPRRGRVRRVPRGRCRHAGCRPGRRARRRGSPRRPPSGRRRGALGHGSQPCVAVQLVAVPALGDAVGVEHDGVAGREPRSRVAEVRRRRGRRPGCPARPTARRCRPGQSSSGGGCPPRLMVSRQVPATRRDAQQGDGAEPVRVGGRAGPRSARRARRPAAAVAPSTARSVWRTSDGHDRGVDALAAHVAERRRPSRPRRSRTRRRSRRRPPRRCRRAGRPQPTSRPGISGGSGGIRVCCSVRARARARASDSSARCLAAQQLALVLPALGGVEQHDADDGGLPLGVALERRR